MGVLNGCTTRHLDWDGCYNIRDLGGIPVPGGGTTPWKAVVRADNPARLTPAGWSALRAYGIRTIVDLRNPDEHRDTPPPDLTTVHVPLDDVDDTAFWQRVRDDELDGTPLYYRMFLEHKTQRCAAAVAAVARARPGGVLIHCSLGRDRTGLVAMLLLALAGVRPHDIADDYELSTTRLPPLFAALGMPDQTGLIQDILARKNTTLRTALFAALDGFDVEGRLREAGLTDQDVQALRTRLLGPSGHTTPPGRRRGERRSATTG